MLIYCYDLTTDVKWEDWEAKGDYKMYYYVDNKKFLKRAKSLCSSILKGLEEILRSEYDINSQFFLVGSGARSLITQNGNEGIDFDYNLNIISCPDWHSEKDLKESVRKAFNKAMKNHGLSDVEDSTSSLTTKMIYFEDDSDIKFSIDVCIVTKNTSGTWERLIHEKTGFTYYDRYLWNSAPHSNNYQEKVQAIKSVPGWWDQVLRPKYLDKKNFYLRNNDYNHPSFICYIEAINDVYNTMKQKHII